MIIQNTSTINFKAKLDTNAVLETTTLKIFHFNGTEGWKQVITALNGRPSKGIGSRGYRYYAKIIGEKIIDKYPKIKEATEKIHKLTANNPELKKAELNEKIKPIVEEIGREIDIIL